MNREELLPLGVKLIIGFHLLSFLLWSVGQTGALIAYDTVAGWGLQDARDQIDPVIVQVNKAIALTDTIIMLPLFIVAAVGLIRMRFYGVVASWMVFGMTLYWPVVFWSAQAFYAKSNTMHASTSTEAIALPAVLWMIAAWGSLYLFRKRGLFH